MDGDDGGSHQITYRTTTSLVRAGSTNGCTLCSLLIRQVSQSREDGDGPLEFILEIDKEEDENGPSPGNTPRLRMMADHSSSWAEYCLYASPGTSTVSAYSNSSNI